MKATASRDWNKEMTARSLMCARMPEKHDPDVRKAADEVSETRRIDWRLVEVLGGEHVSELDQTQATPTQPAMCRLIDHIIAHHHAYLRRHLPRLQLLLDLVTHQEGQTRSNLDRIRSEFGLFRAVLVDHMVMGEQVLFPLIQELEWAMHHSGCCYSGRLGWFATKLERDRAYVDQAMGTLRELTGDFRYPADAGVAYKRMINGLAELDKDLNQHFHLEVDVLLRQALAAEAGLRGTHDEAPVGCSPSHATPSETDRVPNARRAEPTGVLSDER